MNRKVAIVIGIICMTAIAIIAFRFGREPVYRTECDIYFLNEGESAIVSEKRTVKYRSEQELRLNVVEALISGPKNSKNRPVISRRVRTISVDEVSPGEIVADFDYKFLTRDSNRDVLSVYAVVKSLCAIEGVDKVKVTVGGQDVVTQEGKAIGFLADEDINLSTDTNTSEIREVTLYFEARDGGYLVAEKRKIKVTDQQPLAHYVINELIQGTKEYSNILSRDIILLGVNITENICFVNFQSNFVSKNTGTREKETLAIYSIVNSLTELENIGRVQFLIDGKKVEKFGNLQFDGLFERNTEVIEKH